LAAIAIMLVIGIFVLKMPFGPPLVLFGIGGLALTVFGRTAVRTFGPLFGMQKPPEDRGPHAPTRIRELQHEKTLVLKILKEIELDYQMRKISKEDYESLTKRYRARALRIISDLESGEGYRAVVEMELRSRLYAEQAAEKNAPTQESA
jgi:hypothetical protein